MSAIFLAAFATAQTPVTTWHYDNSRTGLNSTETKLTPANVSPTTFGLLFADAVDGQVYAQPLYVPGVTINGKVHNVVYVVTEHNSIYAFDADTAGTPLWHVNEGPSVPSNDAFNGYTDVVPEIGITGTPVIDETNGKGIIYFVAKTKEASGSNNYVYVQRIHALDITTGNEAITPNGASSPGPVLITATVAGTGEGTDGNGNVPFNPLWQFQRPALLLLPIRKATLAKTLVIAWASHGDANPYHGWLMAYNASSLAQMSVFNTTPNALNDPSGYPIAAGGVWMSGSGIASDGTSIYFATGNGTFDPSTAAWGDSILKMSLPFTVTSSFTPNDQLSLDDGDTDQGSGGLILLPPSVGSTAHPNLLVQEGKSGTIYLCDVTGLGGYNPTDAMVQEVDGANGGVWGGMAYYNGNVYIGSPGHAISAFGISEGILTSTPVTAASQGFSWPAPTPSISSNGTSNGIVWAVDSSLFGSKGPEYLYAYDATTLNTLYSSASLQGRDNFGSSVKFITPIVSNGKVYVGSGSTIGVFGLESFTANPTSNVATGSFSSSFQVTLHDATPGARIYYTLDGTIPNTYSARYSTPFTISANATLVVKAVATGYGPSSADYYFYSFPPVVSGGTGLTGKYYNGTMTPAGTVTLTRLDPTINFNWAGASPGAGIGTTNWSAEWNGFITPQFTGPYNIYLIGDDGIRLWLNGREVINGWVDQAPTGYSSGRYNLIAGHKYPIKIDYYQNQGGSLCQLQWQTLGTQLVTVPSTQLSPN
ncbi:MAG TPA: PA14 domain-containing protein [Fimbriimonadaceae bacterium]